MELSRWSIEIFCNTVGENYVSSDKVVGHNVTVDYLAEILSSLDPTVIVYHKLTLEKGIPITIFRYLDTPQINKTNCQTKTFPYVGRNSPHCTGNRGK